jgi:hypothetical protein
MENTTFSILDQIIDNQKAEEVANLDAVEIITNLFGELSDREKDVLIRRYGLHGEGKETLESIGTAHKLTRERIRQIETGSIKKLQQLKNLESYVNNLKRVVYQLLEEHGGIMEKNYLLDILASFSASSFKSDSQNEIRHKNYLNFLITKLLYQEFEEVINSSHFLDSYKLKYQELDYFEEIVTDLLNKIEETNRILKTEELINIAIELNAYKKHLEKINTNNRLDISRILKSDLFEENADVVNKNKVIYTIFKAAKEIEQNKFGYWGLNNWREIKPKTINDKIYLILKNNGKPMHFVEIAEIINKISFDEKKANPATVHNELILDNKYVLIGRGMYGLKEWGYEKGTVSDVIEEVLKNENKPLKRDEIINKVLEKRMVKKATIVLALMNKNKFDKISDGYVLKIINA